MARRDREAGLLARHPVETQAAVVEELAAGKEKVVFVEGRHLP